MTYTHIYKQLNALKTILTEVIIFLPCEWGIRRLHISICKLHIQATNYKYMVLYITRMQHITMSSMVSYGIL